MKKQRYVLRAESSVRSHRHDGRDLWSLTVRAKNLPGELKFGPNARYADLRAKPAKAMLETLKQDPWTFIFRNNGIMIVADTIEVEGNEVVLTCLEADADDDALGHGILNGGHTAMALREAMSKPAEYPEAADKALVSVTIATGVPEDEIWTISKARNLSQPVPQYALRELQGDWRPLKEYLPPASRHLVAFKPNDPEAPDALFDATDLVRRLTLIHNQMFPAEEGKHPVAAYTSIGQLAKRFNQKVFFEVAPLLPDVLQLEEAVIKHWASRSGKRAKDESKLAVVSKLSGCSTERSTLLTGNSVEITMSDSFVLPVVAAFRVFVKDGKWTTPWKDLWNSYGPRTVELLFEAYKEFGRSSAAIFGRSRASWAAACELTKSVALQDGLIRVSKVESEG
jgi:AIPR protein